MSVEEENEWIDKRFNCNITKPFITMEQLELLEAGFEVDIEIPDDHIPLPEEVVERAIRIANNKEKQSGMDLAKSLYSQPKQ